MALNIGREITGLQRMTVPELRRKYTEVLGENSNSRHKGFLVRRIIWHLQVQQEGGLSERARLRAKELAADSDVRLTEPRPRAVSPGALSIETAVRFSQDERLPMPGALLTRQYKGKTIQVRVLPRGFEYEGEAYRSLSAVAKKVTGAHWNGFAFFQLGEKGAANDQ
jgi:hypothetical protein